MPIRHEPRACPHCGAANRCSSDGRLSDAKPKPGDASLCAGCGELAVYQADLSLRLPTADELASFEVEEPLLLDVMRRNVAEFHRTGRRSWLPEEWTP